MKQIFKDGRYTHLLFLAGTTKFFTYLLFKAMYPLAAFLQEDWQIDRSDFNVILALSELSALPSIFIAPLADKYKIEWFVVTSWFLVAVSTLLLSFSFSEHSTANSSNKTMEVFQTYRLSFYYVLSLRILTGLSSQIFLTTNLTILLATMPSAAKEAAAGIVEYAWALSSIIGIPFMAYVYDVFGVVYVFLIPGLLMLLLGVDFAHFLLIKKIDFGKEIKTKINMKSLAFDILHPSFVLLCIEAVLMNLVYNGLYTVLSLWFRDEFDQSVSEIGTSFFIIGIAELSGVSLYSVTAANKPKHIFSVAYLAKIVFIISLTLLAFITKYTRALIFIYFAFFMFEYITVSIVVGAADFVHPKHRVTALSVFTAFMFLGRSLGAIIGGSLYIEFGFKSTILVLAISLFVSFFFLLSSTCLKRNFENSPPLAEEEIPQEKKNTGDDKSSQTKTVNLS